MAFRVALLVFLGVPLAALISKALADPNPGPRGFVLVIGALWGLLFFVAGVAPILLARSVWRQGDGSMLLKAGPLVRRVIPAADLRTIEVRAKRNRGKAGTYTTFGVWLWTERPPSHTSQRSLTLATNETDCVAFAKAIADGFGIEYAYSPLPPA